MAQLPEIENPEYHGMSFEEVDKISEQIASGKQNVLINESQLFLYLNQMEKKYSFKLKMTQNISIASLIGMVVFIFINWKISPILFIVAIIAQVYSRKLAKQYIYKQCSEDRVYLKFALAVGLAKLAS